MGFFKEEIIKPAKGIETLELLTNSGDDCVEMIAKTKISNADAKKSFSV